MLFSQACGGTGSLFPWLALMSLQNSYGLSAIPGLVPLATALGAPCDVLCLQYEVLSRKASWTLPRGKAQFCPHPRAQPTVGPLSPALVPGKAPAWSHLCSHPTLEQIPGVNIPGKGIPEVFRLKLFNLELKMQHCQAASACCVVLVARIYISKLLCCQEYNRRRREKSPARALWRQDRNILSNAAISLTSPDIWGIQKKNPTYQKTFSHLVDVICG